jgi:hypothetical protein
VISSSSANASAKPNALNNPLVPLLCAENPNGTQGSVLATMSKRRSGGVANGIQSTFFQET